MKELEKQPVEENQELPEQVQTLEDEDLEEVAGGWTDPAAEDG